MKDTKKQIEVEMRAIFNKEKYDQLKSFLDINAKDLGEDDKDTFVYLLPDKIIKAVNNVSHKTAKIVLKLNQITKASAIEEIEIPINPSDFQNAAKLFSSLPFDQSMNFYQKRHNYIFNGVEIALKYSEDWGYHMELEVLVTDWIKQGVAEEKIHKIAKQLGVKIMTEQDTAEFVDNFNKIHHYGKYQNTK